MWRAAGCLVVLLVGSAGALQLPLRRDVLIGGAALAALATPEAALASKSKYIETKNSPQGAKARAKKFAKPTEESDSFRAAERRRADVEAGITPRDPDQRPKPKPPRTYAEALAAGEDACGEYGVNCRK